MVGCLCVDQCIGGVVVEVVYVVVCVGQDCDVVDFVEIVDDLCFVWCVEYCCMECGCEWCVVIVGGYVMVVEIGDYVDLCQFGEQCWIVELVCIVVFGVMVYCLVVYVDCVDFVV